MKVVSGGECCMRACCCLAAAAVCLLTSMASPRSTRVTTRVRSLSCATITRAAGSASHALIAFHAVRVLHAFAITSL